MRRPGWRKRRIAELEQELLDTRENLAIARVVAGSVSQDITVRKGVWYRVSYSYLHTGGPILDVANLFVAEDDSHVDLTYFDGDSG